MRESFTRLRLADGDHAVDYRSADKAGNLEAFKSIAFGIKTPSPGFPQIEALRRSQLGAAPLPVRFSASGHRSRRGNAELQVAIR